MTLEERLAKKMAEVSGNHAYDFIEEARGCIKEIETDSVILPRDLVMRVWEAIRVTLSDDLTAMYAAATGGSTVWNCTFKQDAKESQEEIKLNLGFFPVVGNYKVLK